MDAVHLVDGRSIRFVRRTDPGSSPAALFLVGDPEQVPSAQSLGVLCEVVTFASHPSKPPPLAKKPLKERERKNRKDVVPDAPRLEQGPGGIY